MKVFGYVCAALAIACLSTLVSSEKPQNKIPQQLLDAIAADETLKMKRPFCNAFTGCGKKRSFYDNAIPTPDSDWDGTVKLPLTVYKALLKAASGNIQSMMERDGNENQSPDIPQAYVYRRMPMRKRLDASPSSELD